MTAEVALRPGPLVADPAVDEAALDPLDPLDPEPLPAEPVAEPAARPGAGRRGVAGALVAAALAGAVASPAAAPLRDAGAQAAVRAAAAMTLDGADLATLPVPPQAGAPVLPPEVLAARERGRSAAEDTAVGLRRTAVLLDAAQPREALQAFTLAVQALALVPADEPRRTGLVERARQVRGRLVAALEAA